MTDREQRAIENAIKNSETWTEWETPEQVLKSRADRCDAHFLGCDCHEYRVQQEREKLAAFVSIAGADPGDIDGAIIMLKERQRQIGLQSNELGQLRQRVNELEAQVAGFGELATAQYAQVNKLEAEVERLRRTLDTIFALAFDYDGFKKPESLKSLIRDMAAHAYHKKPELTQGEMEDGWRIDPIGRITKESEPTDE